MKHYAYGWITAIFFLVPILCHSLFGHGYLGHE